MAPHSSTRAWKVPWTEEPGSLQSMGGQESDMTERLHFHFSLSCTGEGNGNPLQCSCLENPRDGGAWWAAVCGVAQSQTRLKRLSRSSKLLKINNYFSTLNPSQRTEVLQSSLLTYSSIYLVQWFFSKSRQILLTQWLSSKGIIFSVFNPSKAKLLVSSQRVYFSHL